MTYFFAKWHDFAAAVKNKDILLLFDFDGTLTPIIPEPEKVRLSGPVRGYLRKLSRKKCVDVGIVSGRELKYVINKVGLKGAYYAGNHGLEIKGSGRVSVYPPSRKYIPYIKKISAALKKSLAWAKGALIEDKKLSLSLHYRRVPKKEIAGLKSIFKKITAPYVKKGMVKVTPGKKILEVRPPVSRDKGQAVRSIAKLTGKKNAVKVFVGDDVTDEDAFGALGEKDFSIRVGRKKSSKARYFLKNPNEVRRLLVKINEIIVSALVIFTVFLAAPLFAEVDGTATSAAASTAAPKDIKLELKEYTTRTSDGWDISIKRYITKGKDAGKPRAAVILCHGFNINNNFWDIDKRSSLARFLAGTGYDIWVPSLRGSGSSSKPVLSRIRSIVKFEVKEIPQMLIKTPFDISKFGWTVDDHIHKDAPAIIDFVRKNSGFDKVYWIGHSMGGIIMFGYLETEGQDKIAGFIPMGSMMVMPDPLTPPLKKIADQKQLLTASLLVNTTMASQLSNFTLGAVKSPIEELLLKRENMYSDVVFRFFRTCIDDTSAGVVSQFSDSIRAGEMLSRDGKYSYTKNLYRVTVPVLFMAGGSDGFVSEKIMRSAYEAVSSKDKEVIVFSKANGYTTDYGHCDLVIGKNSGKDMYAAILQWLDKRAPLRQ